MLLSIFLAKLIGVYLLIAAADLLLRKEEFQDAVRDFSFSKGLLMFSGSVSLIIGLAIVLGHPVYKMNWQGLITLLGYFLILKGILRVAFPNYIQKRITAVFYKGYWVICFLLLVIGFYLSYVGFTE